MAIIVPKSHEVWTQDQPYRVEHYARHDGAIRRVYFEGSAEALAFAISRSTWGGEPCVVESRDMPITHEVHHIAVDRDYTLSIKRFGDLQSALVEFNFAKTHARKYGGRIQLRAVGISWPLTEFSHSLDCT